MADTKMLEEHSEDIFKDPAVFFEVFSPFGAPYEYQAHVLRDRSRFISVVKGRQVGMSWAMAMKILWEALMDLGDDDSPYVAVIFSKGERQSKLLFKKIRRVVNNSPLQRYVESDTVTSMKFTHGPEIHAVPSGNTGDQIRGFSANTLLATEAAFIHDNVFDSLEPMLFNTGGNLYLESSPMGKNGKFYRSQRDEEFSRYHVSSKMCPDIANEDLESWRRDRTKADFKREVLGEFVEDSDTYFPMELIRGTIGTYSGRDASVDRRFLSVDLADSGKDETIFVIFRLYEDGMVDTERVIARPKDQLSQTEGNIKRLHEIYEFSQIVVDASGMGTKMPQDLKEADLPVKGFESSTKNKEEAYTTLKKWMENERIKFEVKDKLPSQIAEEFDDGQQSQRDLIKQFDKLKKSTTTNGTLKFSHPQGGHDDYPDAVAMGVWLIEKHSYEAESMDMEGFGEVLGSKSRYDVSSQLG